MNQTSQEGAGATPTSGTTAEAPVHPRFAKPQRVAFVQSAWHRDVVAECREAFLTELEARHIARAHIDVFEVPGSFEIPLHVQLLAKTRRYTAIVAAGLVVDDEYIAETVIRDLEHMAADIRRLVGQEFLDIIAVDRLAATIAPHPADWGDSPQGAEFDGAGLWLFITNV